jgi:hypothetical protein
MEPTVTTFEVVPTKLLRASGATALKHEDSVVTARKRGIRLLGDTPITVRKTGGTYTIVSDDGTLAARRSLRLATTPVVITEADSHDAHRAAAIEKAGVFDARTSVRRNADLALLGAALIESGEITAKPSKGGKGVRVVTEGGRVESVDEIKSKDLTDRHFTTVSLAKSLGSDLGIDISAVSLKRGFRLVGATDSKTITARSLIGLSIKQADRLLALADTLGEIDEWNEIDANTQRAQLEAFSDAIRPKGNPVKAAQETIVKAIVDGNGKVPAEDFARLAKAGDPTGAELIEAAEADDAAEEEPLTPDVLVERTFAEITSRNAEWQRVAVRLLEERIADLVAILTEAA